VDDTNDPRTIAVGTMIKPYRAAPSAVQLFRFSAVTWNAHRIHFDDEYARSEGYAGIVVQSHLHGCVMANAILEWAGPAARLRAFRWENRGIAVAGDVLTVTGSVTGTSADDDLLTIEVALEERNQRGELCAPGGATLTLPLGVDLGSGT
jgi:hydroxyacyl-ACP dehydratase HTD2-like protein with hotdog domain